MPRRLPRLRRIHAFTLLELSVSIAIIGIMMGSTMVVMGNVTHENQVEVDTDRINAIVNSLIHFKERQGYLPCPAALSVTQGTAGFGKEANSGDCTYTSAPAGTSRIETVASSGIWMLKGAVPVRDLGLRDDFMRDEHGNRYTYAVMQSLTEAGTFDAGAGGIIVKDSAANSIITDGAFVVVSHGKEGEGAYSFMAGTARTACGATNLDIENCDADVTFIDTALNDTTQGATYFSDLIRWKSKQSIITPTGGGGGGSPSPSPSPSYGTPPTTYAFRVDGIAAADTAGRGTAICDVNGDGFGDAVSGGFNGGTRPYTHVLFGSATGIDAHPKNLSTLDGTNGFLIVGPSWGYSGQALSCSDVNNDGFGDLIIGALYVNSIGGYTYVVFGKASGWAASMDVSSLNGTTGFRIDGENANDQSGSTVSSGDINNDGFGDIIIGARVANKTYVIFGKASAWASTLALSSLNGTTGFRLTGTVGGQTNALSIGDINGDGYDDVLIGDDYVSNAKGYTYTVFGKAGAWAASTALSSLDGTTGFVVTGTTDYDRAMAVSSGDINNDGFDDLIVGASGTYYAPNPNGLAYVVFGKASGWAASTALSSLNGTTGFRLDGVAANDAAGEFTASGDVNGDGFDDIVISGRNADNGGVDSGATYVVFGKAGAWSATSSLSTLNGTTGFRLDGSIAVDRTSSSIAVGDMNGDNYADILIGASEASYNNITNAGSVYGVYGRPSSDPIPLTSGANDLNTLCECPGTPPTENAFRLDGVAANDRAGYSTTIGDINGDGFGDAIIGAYNAGFATAAGYTYVVFGSSTGINWHPDSLSTLNGTTGFRLDGVSSWEYSGFAVSSGDINNDGYDDVIIGAPGATGSAGYTYVVFGKAGAWAASTDLSTLNGTTGFKLNGNAADYTSNALSSGDINRDGFDDVIIGSASSGGGVGYTYVVFGKAGAWAATTALSALNGTTGFRLDGATAGDFSATSVSSGDINNDGYNDVIVGASDGNSAAGYTYVVFGKSGAWAASTALSSLNGTTGFRLDGVNAGDHVGVTVASGNINGDAYDDVIVGANGTDALGVSGGSTYVVFGKAGAWAASTVLNTTNLDGTTGFRFDGWGESRGPLGKGGDVNGDGFDELINTTYMGEQIFVVFGKASGWAATQNIYSINGTNGFRLDASTNGDHAGFSVAFGDMTGDYYADLLIGAESASYNSLANSGSVYGVYGKSITWSPTYDLNAMAGIAGSDNSSATFVGTDATTQGNWEGVFGNEGYRISQHTTSNPSYASITFSGNNNYTWNAATSDVRALNRTDNADRIASTWYTGDTGNNIGSKYNLTVDNTDGLEHQISIYFLDWDSAGPRDSTVEVRSSLSGLLLDSQSVTGYYGGKYLSWNVMGDVYFRIINNVYATNATPSGLFFDPVVVGGGPTDCSGITYTYSSMYGGYTGYNSGKMCDSQYGASDTVIGTNSGSQWINANLGSATYINNVHLGPINSTFGGWGAGYLNGYGVYCNGLLQLTISGTADNTSTSFGLNTTCNNVSVEGVGYIGIGEFWFD